MTGFSLSAATRVFPALKHRNFRLFWIGQLVSLSGTWMQNIALSWLVLQLTDSPWLLGVNNAIQFLPIMLFSLFAGPLVDRFPKRTMLIFTQSALLTLALILTIVTATGLVQYWMLLLFSLILGLINTIDIPTRQAFIIELVGGADIMNAISLNSMAFNLTRIIGPAIGGLLIALIGIAPCFLINALSFVAVVDALFLIKLPPTHITSPANGRFSGVLASAWEGLVYIKERPPILLPIILLAITSTFVINFQTVVPAFAAKVLAGDARHFGFLMTAMGIGSFLAALSLAARSKQGPRPMVLLGGALGMSVFLGICGLQSDFLLSCILLAVCGFFTVIFTASSNVQVQMNSDNHMRGRVMSVYSLVFGGVTPIGSLYAGALIDGVGTNACLWISGIIGVITSLVIGGLVVRRRYQRQTQAVINPVEMMVVAALDPEEPSVSPPEL